MIKDEPGPDQAQDVPVEDPLRRHLQDIEREEAPERLLELARELQRLLRLDEG